MVNGVALRPGAGTAFAGIVPGSPDRLELQVTDGAGVAGGATLFAARGAPPGTTPKARATSLRARLVRGRIIVTLRLSAAATVKVSLLRRTVRRLTRPARTKIVLRRVGAGVTRKLGPGLRAVRLPRRRLVPGARYVVRVRVISAGGTTTRTTRPLVIPARRTG